MVAWSLLRNSVVQQCRSSILRSNLNFPRGKDLNKIQIREMKSEGGEFIISPSNYQWQKFKDIALLYTTIGAIPILCLIFYCNVFIGPATLQPIPEGYEPKPWEYYRHPITRFFARYVVRDAQKDYEKVLHVLYNRVEKKFAYQVEMNVKEDIAYYRDYQAWYYTPAVTSYARKYREEDESVFKKEPPTFAMKP